MPERSTAARAVTENTKLTTEYTYDYDRLPPLAMAGALPELEAFSARPDWIHLVALPVLEILINSIMIGVKSKGGNIEFVQLCATGFVCGPAGRTIVGSCGDSVRDAAGPG